MNTEQELLALSNEARKASATIARYITALAKSHAPKGCNDTFATHAGELVLQNLMMYTSMKRFPPGSIQGAAMLRKCYEEFGKSALRRWQKDDLKVLATHAKD